MSIACSGGKFASAMAIMPDLIEPVPPGDDDTPAPSLLARIGWFVAIALLSVTAVAVAAYALKALLPD